MDEPLPADFDFNQGGVLPGLTGGESTGGERETFATRLVWLNAERTLCLRRCKERTDHPTLKPQDA